MKNILTSLFVLASLYSLSQTTTVSISPSSGILDSTFVVTTGISSNFNSTNHSGAEPCMNAEIY